MPRFPDKPGSPLAEDYRVGDDDDMPGLDEPISVDDIDAVLFSPRGSLEERRETLLAMLHELQTRQSMDADSDMQTDIQALVDRIEDALASLDADPTGDGTPDAYGFDPDLRAEQPDEILERAEDEAAEDGAADGAERGRDET
jgi:hypothetical protein